MSSRRLTLLTLLGLLLVNLIVGGVGAFILFNKVTESKYRMQMANNQEYARRFALALGAQLRAGYSDREILDFLQEALEASPPQGNRYLCLISDGGVLLCHPESDLRGHDVSEGMFFLPIPKQGYAQSYLEWLADGGERALLVDQEGQPGQLIHRTSVDGAPWNVLVHSDLDVLEGEIRAINSTILAVLIPMGALFVLVGTLVVRKIGRRYEAAIEDSNRDLERRVAERTAELEHTITELQHTQDALVLNEKLALMGQLMAGIAHEIRNPLGTITLFAGTWAEDAKDDDEREAAAKILRATERCELIITNLLSFARNDSPRPSMVSVSDLIDSVLTLMGAEFRHGGVALKKQIETPEKTVFVDRIQMEQVILNLLTNALQELRQTEGDRLLRLHCTAEDEMIVICVEDSGKGLPKSIEEHVFEPFHTTRTDGTGLGLSLCRRFVEHHHGSIEYDNSPDLGGARFTVKLPIAESGSCPAVILDDDE